MIFLKSLLTGVLYDCFKLKFVYFNEGLEIGERHSCLKLRIKVHLHDAFSQFLLNMFYLNDSFDI